LLSPWLAAQSPLYREEIVDPDGIVRRYAIYSLADTTLAGELTGRSRP
jgi:hypothetical protein